MSKDTATSSKSRGQAKQDSDTDEMTRQVDPKVLDHYRLERRAEKALMGYAKLDILTHELTFGPWNTRELDSSEKRMLIESFNVNGLRRFEIQYAIPIVVSKQTVVQSSVTRRADVKNEKPDGSHLRLLRFEPAPPETILSAGGRHRKEALKDWLSEQAALLAEERMELERLQKAIRSLDSIEVQDDLFEEEIQQREERINIFDTIVSQNGEWIVAVYDQGKFKFVCVRTYMTSFGAI